MFKEKHKPICPQVPLGPAHTGLGLTSGSPCCPPTAPAPRPAGPNVAPALLHRPLQLPRSVISGGFDDDAKAKVENLLGISNLEMMDPVRQAPYSPPRPISPFPRLWR